MRIERPGRYRIHVEFDPEPFPRQLSLHVGSVAARADVPAGARVASFATLGLEPGPARFEASLLDTRPGAKPAPSRGIRFAELERAGD